jgi:NCS1 family nucleobase:cation symporter-1
VQEEAAFGFMPTLKKDRIFGWLDFTLVQAGFGIAAWCFLVGGLTGVTLQGRYAIWVILLGNAIPVLLCLPFALQTARLGVDTFIASNMALGYRFSQVFFVIFTVLNLGWIAIANFMLGQSAAKLAGVASLPEFLTTRTVGAPIWSIAFMIVALYITYLGPRVIKTIARIGVPCVIAILLLLIGIIVFKYGFSSVWESQPSAPYTKDDGSVDFGRSVVTALEWNVGLGFSWLVYLGQWCRLARTEGAAINGSYLGLGLLLNIAAIFGAFIALILGDLNPPNWMLPAGGSVIGVLGLALLVLANLYATAYLMYAQALSMKTLSPRMNWRLCVLTCVPAVFLVVTPGFYDSYQRFLVLIAYVIAVFGGVLVFDWLFVHSRKGEIGALYDRGNPQYRYLRGWNPAAVLTFIAGTGFYWFMYNPWTDTPGPLMVPLGIGAGIPSFFLAGALYVVLAKTVFRRLYAADRAWRRSLSPAVAGGQTPGEPPDLPEDDGPSAPDPGALEEQMSAR